MLPCVLHEDEHLLAIHKPAGWNTHAPSPYAGEGIYDWLRHRDPRWANLALVHRLDKDTSGVMVMGKTPAANRGLNRQFENRQVRKFYRFLTDRPATFNERTVRSSVVRAGNRYVARPVHPSAPEAVTHLRRLATHHHLTEWEARPETGQTHQIRVHAAAAGLPILGDTLYDGTPPRSGESHRLCLHAETLELQHPVDARPLRLHFPAAFQENKALALRGAIIDPTLTTAFRVVHGAGDNHPGRYLDRWGEVLLWQHPPYQRGNRPPADQLEQVQHLAGDLGCPSLYHQQLERRLQRLTPDQLAPQLLSGPRAPDAWPVTENGVRYEVRFGAGYSVGLFLDQRDNRRRLLHNHVAAGFPIRPEGLTGAHVLNTFAYTCGFSLCAALAGATTTSIDLSRPALDWGQRNFRLNGIDPSTHRFLRGEVLDWARRLRCRNTQFDLVLVDPPTFSRSKTGGVFRAEQDYPALLQELLPLVRSGGCLFVSTNATAISAPHLLQHVHDTVASVSRSIAGEHYAPQPPDFPSNRDEPAHLKTAWFRIN